MPIGLLSAIFLVGAFLTVIYAMFEYILTPAWELKSQLLWVSLFSDGDLYLPSADGRWPSLFRLVGLPYLELIWFLLYEWVNF